MDLLEEQRETWGTRGGFVLAAVGSAVGLGNLWGFPYKLYTYGGGAFLIPYIIAMFCIGVPMLIMEFSLGHFTQRAAPNAFGRIKKDLEFVGWWGIILGFVIITYYPTILAYCCSYFYYSVEAIVRGTALPWAGVGVDGVANAGTFFEETYLTGGRTVCGLQLNIVIPLMVSWVLMYFCIFKGVKLVGKIVWLTVPLPFLILMVLMVRGLTLPGSMEGLVYYLDPTWSELAKPTTWRFAFGQVFFSLSLAFGVMITYASFLHRKSDINNNAAIIGIADFATSFLGGIAIFATLGGMAWATTQAGNPVAVDKVVNGGPGLAFVAFPYALAQLPGAAWWSVLFFFTLITLGIDSAFSITESVLTAIVDKTGWKRWVVLPAMSLVGLGFGLVYVTKGGLNWLGTIDGFINGTWGIAFLGLLECVVLGWLYRADVLRKHANERSDWYLGRWWNYAIRVGIPIVLGTLFMWSLADDLGSENFWHNADGTINVYNRVGVGVIVIAPLLAILMSMLPNAIKPKGHVEQKTLEYPKSMLGRVSGGLAFGASLVPLVVFGVLEFFDGEKCGALCYAEIAAAIIFGLAAVVIANNILEWCSINEQRPSRLSRWAGIIAVFDISAGLAALLINLTGRMEKAPVEDAQQAVEVVKAQTLSGQSYVILSVVFLIIVVGLGWCFYRAINSSDKSEVVEQQAE